MKDPNTPQKKAVRELIMSKLKHYEKLVGLPGPFAVNYTQWAIESSFKEVEFYEIDGEVLIHQVNQLNENKKLKEFVKLSFGNINKAPIEPKTLYDLDYCQGIKAMSDAVKKFKDNFIMTFSRRGAGNKTIDIFFTLRNEIVKMKEDFLGPIKHSIYTTMDGSKYIYCPYFDTSAMCCIAKIK